MSFLDNILAALNPAVVDATSDYTDASDKLKKFNQPLVDKSTVKILDTNSQSFLKDFRDMMDELRKVKFLDRDEYLGIVIGLEPQTAPEKIYVDVPGISIENINQIEDATPEFLEKHKYKVFYPVSENVLKMEMPSLGTIVRVKPSKEYFSSHISRPYENKYLGIYSGGQLLVTGEGIVDSLKAAGALAGTAWSTLTDMFSSGQDGQTVKSPDNSGPPAAIKKTDRYAAGQTIISRDNIEFAFPLRQMAMTSDFGQRRSQGLAGGGKSSSFHYGLDLAAPIGTPVFAVANGKVVHTAKNESGAGTNIRINHDDKYTSRYLHLRKIEIQKDQEVTKGQLIGYTGNSGGLSGANGGVDPHLHFETKSLTKGIFDPQKFYNVKIEYGSQTDIAPVKKEADPPIASSTNESTPAESVMSTQPSSYPAPESTGVAAQSIPHTQLTSGTQASMPVNRPKMLITNLDTDLASGVIQSNKRGSSSIKVREDILSDLISIKNILNKYNIPLCCEKIDVNIKNNISLMAKLGLEIKLNPYSAMMGNNNILFDDYFVGPDYLQPIGNGYKLKVYGNVKRNIKYFDERYSVQRETIEVYTGKFIENIPEIKKILVNYIDLTKIFQDYGFIHADPQQSFFNNSELLSSKWFIFYKPSKFNVGYTYKEALSTIYRNNREHIWNLPDIKWDGERFV